MLQPSGFSNGDLDLTAEASLGDVNGVVERITIRFAEHEEVDVPDGADAAFAGVPGSPRAEDMCFVDSLDPADGVCDHGRHPERLREHICQALVVRALDVGAHKARPSDPPACEEASGLGTLDLAVHRRVRDAGSLSEVGEAQLQLRIAEEQRQQLGLLLGSEDR